MPSRRSAFQAWSPAGGDTENAKYTTAAKYRLNIGNFRVAALGQFGGYEQNNGSDGAWEGQLGGDFRLGPGTLSLDAIYDYSKDAVNIALSGAPTNAQGVPDRVDAAANDDRDDLEQYKRDGAG
jgi:hypothetical protein